jgi:F-type H+-transporting ATPase subunit a
VDAINKLGGPWVPAGSLLLFPIKVLTCTVQALIFTLLFCVYLSLVTHHEDHGDDHGHEPAPAH